MSPQQTAPPNVVVLRAHPDEPGLVVLDTPPDMARDMGRFRPARSVRMRGGSYVVDGEHLPAFLTFAASRSWRVADSRAGADEPSAARSQQRPLPECSACTYPVSRRASAAIAHCPHCGAPWRAVQIEPGMPSDMASSDCPACGLAQPGHLPHCTRCGARLGRTWVPERKAQPRPHSEPLPLDMSGVLAQVGGGGRYGSEP